MPPPHFKFGSVSPLEFSVLKCRFYSNRASFQLSLMKVSQILQFAEFLLETSLAIVLIHPSQLLSSFQFLLFLPLRTSKKASSDFWTQTLFFHSSLILSREVNRTCKQIKKNNSPVKWFTLPITSKHTFIHLSFLHLGNQEPLEPSKASTYSLFYSIEHCAHLEPSSSHKYFSDSAFGIKSTVATCVYSQCCLHRIYCG